MWTSPLSDWPWATDRAGIPESAVPLLFVAFGVGAVIGTNLAGRFADKRPLATFIAATGGTIVTMGLLVPLSTNSVAAFVLMLLLGIAGMGIPRVGTGLAVRFAAAAPPSSRPSAPSGPLTVGLVMAARSD